MSWPEMVSESAEETIELGRRVGALLPNGPTLLIGNLGAGKTTFVKGAAEALGAAGADEVSSPTFPLIHEYGEPVRLFHIDLYRLESVTEVLGIGIEEILDRPAPALIEWGERFPELWPPGTPRIEIVHDGESRRRILIEGLPT